MRIEPLLTASPVTGAVRYLTDDLLREAYLAPKGVSLELQDLLENFPAPWNDSLEISPEETVVAIENGLISIMRATRTLDPREIDPSSLPEGRARSHLTALVSLWGKLDALPAPLSTWAHVLQSEASDVLEPLPLLETVRCAHADPIEAALEKTLLKHHGVVPKEAGMAGYKNIPSKGAVAKGALGFIQTVLGDAAEPVAIDNTIEIFGLRDAREEAEFAAAKAQRLIETSEVSTPSEIGLLTPDDPIYERALAEAFERIGIPLSGLASEPAKRDSSTEILSILLVLLEQPTPRTAIASLFVAPSMPWPRETGLRMAREVMDYGWSRTATELEGAPRELLDALRPSSTPEQVLGRLSVIAKAAPDAGLWPKIHEIRSATVDGLDWFRLHKIAAPRHINRAGNDRFVEGVSLFAENALPWRPVQHLMVLGLAGRSWPRPPASNPFFTESEIDLIRKCTGLCLAGRQHKISRGIELFRRQLCAAHKSATLFVPANSLSGDRLGPSTGLSLITHLLGFKDTTEAIVDLRAKPAETWQVATESIDPLPHGGATIMPESGVLNLGSDLLRLREDEEGKYAPQSPSRLETLIVSPLAWVLDELGARDRTWGPETLDVMTLGTILHHVMEVVFPEGTVMPEHAQVEANIPSALDDAIRRYAKWLSGDVWDAERQNLLREAYSVTANWVDFLRETQAEVLHNETDLAGDYGGLLLRGKADCLLRLPDDRILVVDHKRSSSGGRRDRMAKGWDLQVALYQAMLERPSIQTSLTEMVANGVEVVTAYHTMLDGTVLSDISGDGIARIEVASVDASSQAMDHLTQSVAEVGAGSIRLNRDGDAKAFEKQRGIKAYALEDNVLATSFLMPEEEGVE